MDWPSATPNRRSRRKRTWPAGRTDTRPAKPRAVVCSRRFGGGDRHKRPLPAGIPRFDGARRVAERVCGASRSALAACGGDKERQDADEPSGDFPVAVDAAKFPTDQRLAETSDLRLEVENTGDGASPDLAVTIFTGDEKASGSFSVRSDQPGLADPNRPVWILENGYPKLVDRRDRRRRTSTPRRSAGAAAAQTNTFAFGPLDAGREQGHRLAGDPGVRPAPTRSTTSSRPGSTARPRRSPTTAARSRASSWSRSPTSRREPASTTTARSVIEPVDRPAGGRQPVLSRGVRERWWIGLGLAALCARRPAAAVAT